MNLNLRQMEYLVALAEKLNFREAAEACYVTQPALSTQIQGLERSLGLRLFDRDRRSVRLTSAGREILSRAHEVLRCVADLEDQAHALQAPLSGELRLGVIPTVAPYVLPEAVVSLRTRYPHLKLLLHEDQTDRLIDDLHHAKLDLLLFALEVELGDLHTLPLYRDPFVLAVPARHPLSKLDLIRTRDLADQELLLLEDGHCLRDHALEVCHLSEAHEVHDFRATSLNTLVSMIAAGTGITLLPTISLPTELRGRRGIITRPLTKNAPKRTIGFAWRKQSSRAPEFRLLAEHFRAHAPKGTLPCPH